MLEIQLLVISLLDVIQLIEFVSNFLIKEIIR